MLRCHGDAGAGVQMDDRVDIGPRHQHATVNGEPRFVEIPTTDDIAVEIHLYQIGRPHPVEQVAVAIDQKCALFAGNPRG